MFWPDHKAVFCLAGVGNVVCSSRLDNVRGLRKAGTFESNGLDQIAVMKGASNVEFGGVAEETLRSSEDVKLSDGDFLSLSGDHCPQTNGGVSVRVQRC